MSEQETFFSDLQGALTVSYPVVPGFKKSGTSQLAAPTPSEAHTLRQAALGVLVAHGPQTADQIAAKLGKSVLAVRPRCSELLRLGEIKETNERRRNASGKWANVYATV